MPCANRARSRPRRKALGLVVSPCLGRTQALGSRPSATPWSSGEQGRSAQLSEFGDKLLWAERQAQARLAPQIEALHADLERAFALAFDDSTHVLSLHASHDDALVLLREHAAAHARLQLDIRFTGSVDAISALNQGRCVMAGFHTLERAAIGLARPTHLQAAAQAGPAQDHRIRAAHAGADGRAGQPAGAEEPCRCRGAARARYVNRALGTGTRVLLDELLARDGLEAQALDGYATLRAVARGRGAGRRVRRGRCGTGHRIGGAGARAWASCRWCRSATTWPA